MRIKQTAFTLILIDTAGLLGSEFIFHWDRTVTLLLASVSLLGFVLFGVSCCWRKVSKVEGNLDNSKVNF